MAGGMIQPTKVDKAMIAADPAAAAIGYLSTILAVFGFFDWIGLDADQIAILGGAVLGLFATARHFYEKNRRGTAFVREAAHQELAVAHEELVRKTSAAGFRREDFIEDEEA